MWPKKNFLLLGLYIFFSIFGLLININNIQADGGSDQFKQLLQYWQKDRLTNVITYRSIQDKDHQGIIIHDLRIQDDHQHQIIIEEVDIERLDWARAKQKQIPYFVTATLHGLSLPGLDEKDHPLFRKNKPPIPMIVDIDYVYNEPAKSLLIRNLNLNLEKFGELKLSGTFHHVVPGITQNPELFAGIVTCEKAQIILDDRGILKEIVIYLAREQQKKPEDLVKSWIKTLSAWETNLGPQPRAQRAIKELIGFLKDWQKPNKKLTIYLQPAQPFNALRLMTTSHKPHEMLGLLGLSAKRK